jgi:hypothetical protein
LKFQYDDFQVFIGRGASSADKTKQCSIHINLAYPTGYSYALAGTRYQGYAKLDAGVTATFMTTYFFSQAASQTTTTRTTLTGGGAWAQGQSYTKGDTVPTTALIFSPCGSSGILNLTQRIALTSTNSTASGTVSNDGGWALDLENGIIWRRCK